MAHLEETNDVLVLMRRNIDPVVAARIRALRREAGLSLEALAAEAGLSPNFVGALERGERGASLDTGFRIAGALGVPLDALVEEGRRKQADPRLARVRNVLQSLSGEDLRTAEQLVALFFNDRRRPKTRRTK